jgi:hypothetical protein
MSPLSSPPITITITSEQIMTITTIIAYTIIITTTIITTIIITTMIITTIITIYSLPAVINGDRPYLSGESTAI